MNAYNIMRDLGEEKLTVLSNAGFITEKGLQKLAIYARFEALIIKYPTMECYSVISRETGLSASRISRIIQNIRNNG